MLRLLTLIFECVFTLMVLQSAVTFGESTTNAVIDNNYEVMTNSCWSSNDCLIEANLHFYSGNVLPITVNCSVAENFFDESVSSIMKRRYENISSVTLDGCGAALNVNTFGFEYIPNCGKITTLNLKNFHFDEIYEIICGSGILVENVRYEHNEFAGLGAASISNLYSLRTLHFFSNNLRHMDMEAFKNLHELRELILVEENNLKIRNGKIFENLHRLQKLHISGLDTVTSDLFLHLPVNLDDLTIDKTLFDNKVIVVLAPETLTNLTLNNCGITSATIQGHDMLTHLNLSANALTDLVLQNCTYLKVLDLSSNNLTYLQHQQFEQLYHLDYVYLQRNKFKCFSLLMFSNSLSHLQLIDLRSNELNYLDDITDVLLLNAHLRIFIDGNPWNCLWLVNISYNLPEQYRIFRYEKFISKINVNGLECITYPNDNRSPHPLINGRRNSSSSNFTIIYGGPRESKRNQKAEAFVIVFMLPVGIAFLFVLLYLWINCQKLFHLSYYRSLPLIRGSAERFDIVRQLPINHTVGSQNQGYEIPMTGCKCAGHGNKVCKLNVTYEETPQQNAAKVYEEIIEYNTGTGNSYYDHLNREM